MSLSSSAIKSVALLSLFLSSCKGITHSKSDDINESAATSMPQASPDANAVTLIRTMFPQYKNGRVKPEFAFHDRLYVQIKLKNELAVNLSGIDSNHDKKLQNKEIELAEIPAYYSRTVREKFILHKAKTNFISSHTIDSSNVKKKDWLRADNFGQLVILCSEKKFKPLLR